MALLQWQKGKVIRIENEAPNTRRFLIEVVGLTSFDFKPGQFVTLDLPIHEKPNKRIRSYSISSWPNGNNTFELLIVLAQGGLGTTYLFNEIKVGSELTFRGPQGVFTLPDKIDKDIFFICTGTGIAPFRSMINHIYLHNVPHKKIHLVFGCRKKEDLLYYNELKELAQKMPEFEYHPTLSREQWEGDFGYVHPIYERLCRGKPEAVFYLCGWKHMIDEAKKRIAAMSYDPKRIQEELYG
ncbi:MAG TPA: FAD-dependent oxidoreductase [Chitinophagaceae bacterium]|nr:FAD-dependent oxidoreductase [Chitinophagaceae bacterium]